MGCDIHGWVERKFEGKYVAIKEFGDRASERNYQRFAGLAGVRGEGPEPRGVPDDVSETVAYFIKRWEGDGHSHSWLPIQEAVEIFSVWDYLVDDPVNKPKGDLVYHYFDIWDAEPDDRIVFWFDN